VLPRGSPISDGVDCKNCTEHVNALCEQNTEILILNLAVCTVTTRL
jgi:hypothetical protein